jgi:hypothetical protein
MPEVNEQCPSASYALWSFSLDSNTEQTKMPRGEFAKGQMVQFKLREITKLFTTLVGSLVDPRYLRRTALYAHAHGLDRAATGDPYTCAT